MDNKQESEVSAPQTLVNEKYKFANSYWSSDYRSGIKSLSSQIEQSLAQVHDLRKLVFNYMNYFYSNSEFLNNLGKETYVQDKLSAKSPMKSLKRLSGQFLEATRLDKPIETGSPKMASLEPFKKHIQNLSEESHTMITISSVIDKDILEPITAFIKYNEPIIHGILEEFQDLLADYESKYHDVEKLKKDYAYYSEINELKKDKVRQEPDFEESVLKNHNKDDDEHDGESDNEQDKKSANRNNHDLGHEEDSNKSGSSQISQPSPQNPSTSHSARINKVSSLFTYPLYLGNLCFDDAEALLAFMDSLNNEIPVTYRRIPMPGHKNEIFSSESLCSWITQNRPQKISPTRANLEKIGQSLIDNGLIAGTSILGTKKFRSESMWWEWTNKLVMAEPKNVSDSSSNATPIPPSSSTSSSSSSSSLAPSTTNNNATATAAPATAASRLPNHKHHHSIDTINENQSDSFNLNTFIQTNILKNNVPELLKNLESKYNTNYLDLQAYKFKLEESIRTRSDQLENFEKKRISLTYQSLTILSQVLYNSSVQSTNRLQAFVKDMVESINSVENYEADFNKLSQFSTGIYFPSLASPENLQKRQYSYNEANNNFQNLKLKFNLYKDIPLQVNCANELLSLSSIPEFLFKIIKIIDDSNEPHENIQKSWSAPLAAESNWKFKQFIIDIASNYDEIPSPLNESTFNKSVMSKILSYASTKNSSELINFLKYWLLDIGDSVIPFTVYEPIIQLYKDINGKEDRSTRIHKLVSQLKSVPRSNIASLIYILEHLNRVFDLELLKDYGTTDHVQKDIKVDQAEEVMASIHEISLQLNSMNVIGGVPFIHLIMRPSEVKYCDGFKPPLDIYCQVFNDLMCLDVRNLLLQNLIENEQKFRDKKVNELKSIPIKQDDKLQIPRSPGPKHNDNFTLRPFRTKITPHTSPISSPTQTPVNRDIDLMTRARSSSNALFPPSINIDKQE